jgi:hypothetical protein
LLRTGRSRSVALHPALLRRSYGSIPHDSSPHRSGLSPLHLPAFSGALASHGVAGSRITKLFVPEGTQEKQNGCHRTKGFQKGYVTLPKKTRRGARPKILVVISAVPCGTEMIFIRPPTTPWLATFRRRFATRRRTLSNAPSCFHSCPSWVNLVKKVSPKHHKAKIKQRNRTFLF